MILCAPYFSPGTDRLILKWVGAELWLIHCSRLSIQFIVLMLHEDHTFLTQDSLRTLFFLSTHRSTIENIFLYTGKMRLFLACCLFAFAYGAPNKGNHDGINRFDAMLLNNTIIKFFLPVYILLINLAINYQQIYKN